MTKSEVSPNPQRKLFFGLFVFPLLIAVGMAVLLCSVVLLTNEEETPETLITAIKTGSPNKRWQKAFELSNELNRSKDILRDQGVMQEIIHILEDGAHYDSKTRGYMAIALSHFHTPQAVGALLKVLKDESEDVQLYALWALGVIGSKEEAPHLIPFLSNKSDQIRKIAVYVLGVLGDKQTIHSIRVLLNDSVADVRWNAALSLARFRDASGRDILLQMLERDQLANSYHLNDAEIEKVIINAVKGLALIGNPESLKILETVSRNDKSLKVRQAAIDAIQYQKGQRKTWPMENTLT